MVESPAVSNSVIKAWLVENQADRFWFGKRMPVKETEWRFQESKVSL